MPRFSPLRFAPVFGLLVIGLGLGTGCSNAEKKAAAPAQEPKDVSWVYPTARMVTETEEFTGRTEAVMSVELRSRVTGYLDKALFKEGADIKKGDLLFEIDPRTYQAEYDKFEAQVRQTEANLQRLASDYQRARVLVTTRAISQEELDRISSNRAEAEASLGAARAAVRTAKLNLDFTKITAPLSGRISDRHIDPGNLVKADETVLTTIVQLDPIQASFDIDERTVLRLRRLIKEGKLNSASEQAVLVQLGLADEEGYSLTGTIDFRDNKLDPGTGTLRIRVVIQNKEKLLSPGMFVRMKLPVSLPTKALLIPEEALVRDQGKKAVYVINAENKVELRNQIEIGQLFDGFRMIRKGLEPRDRVIDKGQLGVRPGDVVKPRPAETRSRTANKPAPSSPPSL